MGKMNAGLATFLTKKKGGKVVSKSKGVSKSKADTMMMKAKDMMHKAQEMKKMMKK